MAETIKLYDLAPSPNNIKVRVALNYKGIPFDRIPVKSDDRAEVIRVSRQPLTPVIVHGSTVIFDSGGILRYLEANFPGTPPLFSTDYATMQEIERWELFARSDLNRAAHIIFHECFAEKKDPTESERASRILNDATGRVEDQLAKTPWLVGEKMTAADVAAAPVIYYGMLPPAAAAANPIARFFSENLKLAAGRDRTRAWALKVMAYDK